jgi:NADPH:quinone reductase-like Zn-dependent oxidoreductase
MQAITYDRYGPPDILVLGDAPVPTPAENAILVRVRAVGVNALDWHLLRGEPYLARLSEGLRRPKRNAIGVDVAGTVEAVGAGVTHLRPGDRVFGCRAGGFAEFVAGRSFVPMPEGCSFEHAAATPTAGLTALQGLRDIGGLREGGGQRVLVIGAGGGVGSFAVQIAKSFGATVVAATRTEHLDHVRALGADEAVDYTREDITRSGDRFDVVLDIGGTRRLGDLRRIVADGGELVLVAPQPGRWVGPIVRVVGALASSRVARVRARAFLASVSIDDLLVLRAMIEAGTLTPAVERTYPLAETAEAIRHLESGRVRGKVVVTV